MRVLVFSPFENETEEDKRDKATSLSFSSLVTSPVFSLLASFPGVCTAGIFTSDFPERQKSYLHDLRKKDPKPVFAQIYLNISPCTSIRVYRETKRNVLQRLRRCVRTDKDDRKKTTSCFTQFFLLLLLFYASISVSTSAV